MHRLRSRKPAASVCGRAAQISVLFTNSICQSYVILNTLSGRGEPVPCCVRSGLHFALDLWNSKSGVNILPRLSTHHAKKRLYSSPRHRTKQGQPWFERSQNIVQSNCLPLFFSLSCKHKVSFLVRQWEKTHICPYQYSLGILFIYFFLLQNCKLRFRKPSKIYWDIFTGIRLRIHEKCSLLGKMSFVMVTISKIFALQ